MQYVVVVHDNNNVRKVILTMLKVIYTRIVHKNLFNAEENNNNNSRIDGDDDDGNENAIGIVFMYANQLENKRLFFWRVHFILREYPMFLFVLLWGFSLRIKTMWQSYSFAQ